MKITEIRERDETLCGQLLAVWEESVRATHLFLSEEDIIRLRQQVVPALKQIQHLLTAVDGRGNPIGFMGIQEDSLEMLFLHPQNRGKGLGKQMLQLAVDNYGVRKLCVNEQNPAAQNFYEHMGFTVERRSEYDDFGNPFPILHMVLKKIS